MKAPVLFAFLALTAPLYAQDALNKSRVNIISKPGSTEFSPTISADGRTMIFEAQKGNKKEDKWELYQSTLMADNQWSEPVPLTSINEKCNFIAGPCLNYDGNMLYYTAYIEGVTETEDIFYSELDGQEWSAPKPLGAPINTDDQYEGFPSISADGQSLYFIRQNPDYTYDRKSKEQCFRIFHATRQQDGTWSEPVPLPEPVNTGCERDPRIMADNHTLIFSSIRADGKGKYDLYQTRLRADGNWDEPVALDFVNSPESDQSPCISAEGNVMYYYSDADIYQVTIPVEHRQMINITLLGQVTAGAGQQPAKGVIVVRNVKDGSTYFTQSNEHDGRYSIVMSAGQAYEVTFSNAGYRSETMTFDFSDEETYREERRDVNLSSAWPFALTVHDKDLQRPVNALVTFTRDDGQIVFSDSIAASAMPAAVTLETDRSYTLAAFARNYNASRSPLKFVPASYREGEPHLVALARELVPATTDVTTGLNSARKRVKVSYVNAETGEVIVADAGEVVNLRKGDRYQVMTSSDKGFSYAMQSFVAGAALAEGANAVNVSDKDMIVIPLAVVELTEGTKLALNNIFFETNSSKLNERSTTELGEIVGLLKRNPNVVIEISAYTDDVGSDAYNNNLSQQRAQSVTEFLSGKGIPRQQLVPVGYGEKSPIAPNDSEENRAKNRRVELVVLKSA